MYIKLKVQISKMGGNGGVEQRELPTRRGKCGNKSKLSGNQFPAVIGGVPTNHSPSPQLLTNRNAENWGNRAALGDFPD